MPDGTALVFLSTNDSAYASAAMDEAATTRGGWAKRVHILRALRHRDYRIYWLGFLVSIIGWQIQFVALGWLVLDRTGSPLALGFVSGSQAIATIGFSLAGGVVADRVDRRTLLTLTQAGAMTLSLLLVALVVTDAIEVWHILVIAFTYGLFQAFDQPTRASLVPHLVTRDDLMNAVALTSAVWQSARIVGPAIAGLLISFVGPEACFAVTACGFLTMVLSLMVIRVPATVAPTSGVLADVVAGLAYIRGNSLFMALIGMSFFNAVFGLSYVVLMPVFAREVLEVGPEGLGILLSASGIGALTGTFVVASLGDFPRKGLLIIGGASAFGALLVVFSLSTWLPLSLAILVAMGMSTSLYMTSTMTMLQLNVEDRFRGRVMGVSGLTYSLMPLGGVLSGTVASAFGAPTAVAIGGLAVLVFTVFIGVTQPQFRRARTPASEEGVVVVEAAAAGGARRP